MKNIVIKVEVRQYVIEATEAPSPELARDVRAHVSSEHTQDPDFDLRAAFGKISNLQEVESGLYLLIQSSYLVYRLVPFSPQLDNKN